MTDIYSSSIFQINVRVQEVLLAVEGLQYQTDTAISPLLGRLDSIERSLAQSLFRPDSISLGTTLEPDHQQALVRGTVNKTFNSGTVGPKTCGQTSRQEQETKVAHVSAPTFRFEKSSCKLSCACSCHTRKRHSKPYLMSAVLGSIFRGYYVSLWSTHRCDSLYCGNRSVRYTYEYMFPKWFTERSLLIVMTQSITRGPEFCLRVMRFVPATSQIYKAASSGKLEWVRLLLSQGKASVLDVDEHGHTPLHVGKLTRLTSMD